jgi:hypothetical protein
VIIGSRAIWTLLGVIEMLKFIVVGTGRCGTMYISEVLTKMGIPCGHEWVYSPGPRRNPHIEILGDSSAQAVPFVPEFEGFVFHQVRHPLKVIGSFLGFNLFKDYRWFGADGDFMAEHFHFTGDELGDAMRYYVEWNTRCERSHRYMRYKVEDVDRALLRTMARAIGEKVPDAAIDRALAEIPTNCHTLDNHQPVTWADLPECKAKKDLMEIAVRYGYQPGSAGPRRPHFAKRLGTYLTFGLRRRDSGTTKIETGGSR